MTQEEKAKAYDDAFNRAKSWYTDAQIDFKKSLETLFPGLKCDDEKIRKEIIKCVKNYGPSSANPQLFKNMLAWLEKQGEQNTKQVSIWKHWKDGIAGNGDGKPIYLIKNGYTYSLSSCLSYECDYIELSELDKLMIEKQGEQKPIDKSEPKFHEGEWVVISTSSGEKVVQIDSIEHFKSGKPMYITSEGRWFGNGTKAHLWTIQDAKDGDVLASDNSIFIFQEEYIAEKPIAYCGLMNGRFLVDGEDACWANEKCYPATKEQCDTLFAKMKEAGYEWDSEKKELKKISQRMVSAETKEALYDKPAWSEEDECYMAECINAIATKDGWSFEEKRKTKHWLKSLKQRIGWKPSDEQMIALSEASGIVGMLTPRGMHLQSLYNDLKKLK